MNRVKKFIAIILSTIFCTAMLVACKDNEDRYFEDLDALLSPADPIEISVWHYYGGLVKSNFSRMVEEFNSTLGAEKGIFVNESAEVSTTSLYNNIVDSLNNNIGSKPLPDIIQAYTDTAYTVEQKVGLVDLTKYFRTTEIDAYVDSYIAEGRWGEDNALKILPIAKSTEVLVINEKAWNSFMQADGTVSLDDLATVEGLKRVSEKFYAKYKKAFFGRDSFANYTIVGLKQLGFDIFSQKNGKIVLCEEESAYRKLWDNMYEPAIKGMYFSGSGFRSDEMQNEEIVAYIGSTASANYIPAEIKEVQGYPVTGEQRYDNDVIILPMPIFENGQKVTVQQGAGMSIVASETKKEYASAVFLKWFTENERNLQFAVSTSYSPVKKAVSDLNTIKNSEAFNDPLTKPSVRKMLETCCNMLENYTFYFTAGFNNGANIRDNLLSAKNFLDTAPYKQSMQYKIEYDRKKIEEGLVTAEELLTEANFKTWYSNLIEEIKVMIEQ